MTKRHIVQVVGIMNRGGAETMLMDIFRKLHSNFIFTFIVHYKGNTVPNGDFDEEIRLLGGNIVHIRTVWELGPLSYYKQLKQIFQNLSPIHAVHSHLNAKTGTVAWVAHHAGLRNIFAHSHADIHFRGSVLKRLVLTSELIFQKLLISCYASVNIACSKAALHSLFYSRDIRKKTSIIINNAIDCTRFVQKRSNQNTDSKKLILGSVGRIARIKRYELIVEALDILKQRGVDFLFIFAGAAQDKNYADEIFHLIQRKGLHNHVKWLGGRGDVEKVYSSINLFLGASLSEGLGMSAVESQACGTPCLLSKGFPPEADIHANLVRFVEDDLPESWADAIENYPYPASLSADELKKFVSDAGFNIEVEINKVKALYTHE